MRLVDSVAARVQANEIRGRAAEFASLAKHLMVGKGRVTDARMSADMDRGTTDRVRSILKDATAGTIRDATWAGALAPYRVIAGGFIESLSNFGVFDGMLSAMREVPPLTRLVMVTSTATGAQVDAGELKPISSLELADGTIDPDRVVALIVISTELLRAAGPAGMNLIGTELRSAVARATDEVFITTLAATVSAAAASGDPAADIGTLLAAVATGTASRLFIITSSAIAKSLAAYGDVGGGFAFPGMGPNGGEIAGIRVLVSDAMTAGEMMLVDANSIAAAGGTIALDAGREATVAMTVGSPELMTSLWQANLQGLKCERMFAFKLARTGAVALLDGVNYGAGSP